MSSKIQLKCHQYLPLHSEKAIRTCMSRINNLDDDVANLADPTANESTNQDVSRLAKAASQRLLQSFSNSLLIFWDMPVSIHNNNDLYILEYARQYP